MINSCFNIYDDLPYIVFVIDMETKDIVYSNKQIKAKTDYQSMIYSLDKDSPCCIINNAIPKNTTYDKFCSFNNKWYQITEKLYIQDEKRYKHTIAVDITEYKNYDTKKEQLLQEARLSAMSEMIDMLSHQWRQPLTAININAQSLKLKGQLNKLSTEAVDMLSDSIIKVVRELSDTMNDFNNIFKHSDKQYNIDINTQIQKVVELNSELLKENGIEVALELTSTKKLLLSKKDLMQVILRIFTNAIEAFEKDQKAKKIVIKSFDTDTNSHIEIIDNGKGISDEILPKIYEPYFSTKSYNKKGLGLYFAKVLATEHLNAEILVDNTQNTKFTISLKHT